MSSNFKKEAREWIISIIIAAAIAFIIKSFIFDIIQVSGTSMVPTLHDRDRVAVEKISLYTHNIKRGQIVILDSGDKNHDIYIKRIVGLPKDILEIKSGDVYLNGKKLKESYLKPGTYTDNDMKIVVPDDSVFVLGDNREVSEDSRFIGPIPIKNLKGHAIFRIYPFNAMKKF